MSGPPLPDLDAVSLDGLKKLVVQLLARVSALEEENQQLRAENARLKDLPKKPKLAPGGMDKATEADKQARTRQARRQRRKRQSGQRTPPVTQCHQDKAFLKRSLNIQNGFASILSCPIKWR